MRSRMKKLTTHLSAYSRIMLVFIVTYFNIANIVLGLPPATHQFKQISIPEGLSQNSISSIIQDNNGFLWFGTQDGLNRYDGYEFKIFKHNLNDPHSLSDSKIYTIVEDKAGYIWIGTENGLNRYKPENNHFERFFHSPNDKNSISHNSIQTIIQDHSGNIWIGTAGGLCKLNPRDLTFTRVETFAGVSVTALREHPEGILWVGSSIKNGALTRLDCSTHQIIQETTELSTLPETLKNSSITTIIVDDNSDEKWIGTSKELHHFDGKNWGVLELPGKDGKPEKECYINSMYEAEPGELWIGTESGLFIYNKTEKTIQPYFHNSSPGSISHNSIQCIYKDGSDVIWIGTFGGGINKLTPLAKQFEVYRSIPGNPNTLQGSTVWSIFEDNDKNIWIGTLSGGITKITNQNEYIHYTAKGPGTHSLCSKDVRAIRDDCKKNIWVGTSKGLNKYIGNDAFKRIRLSNDEDKNSIQAMARVTSGNAQRQNILWIGTRNGFYRFDTITEKTTPIGDNNSSLNKDIRTMYADSEGYVWLGTFGGGLARYNPGGSSFTFFRHDPGNENSISHNRIFSIYEDKNNGEFWIGTDGGGLNCLKKGNIDEKNGRFRRYNEDDGLTNGVVYGILEDDADNLWLSTNDGLFKCERDPKKKESFHFTNYDAEDGAQDNEFDRGAYWKGNGGRLYFGGVKGFNSFKPENINKDGHAPKMVISELWVNNVDSLQQLQKREDGSFLLTLQPDGRVFSLEFAAIHFANPRKNKYRYQLKGWDKEISPITTNRTATYTNIPPGDYEFLVKGSNRDGVWSKELSILITILPPFWKTWWAYALYFLFGIFLLFMGWRFWYITKVAKRLKEIDQLKDSFLSNTSHELNTPIQGIIGLAEAMKDNPASQIDKGLYSKLDLIINSGKRLRHLVDDILDLSKLKQGTLQLNIEAVNVYVQVTRTLEIARHFLGSKNLELVNSIDPTFPAVKADEARLQQILHNLVQNAIKFSDKGVIEIRAVVHTDMMVIEVSDTGIGIPKDRFTQIFQSFQQLEISDTRKYTGTGLGLAITKNLVELHGGVIWVTSEVGKGSTFHVSLPIAEKMDSKALPAHTTATHARTFTPINEQKLSKLTVPKPEKKWENQFKILVVEDDPVGQQVLSSHLTNSGFQVHIASSGHQALELFSKNKFDLILLDIMMPEMSGFEVCQKIRENHKAGDLPIIFLTARGQDSDQAKAFETGANDYISKPVSKEVLIKRVNTQLQLLEFTRHLETQIEEKAQELKHSQAQLVQSEKMSSLGVLISGVAHEINNPVSYMGMAVYNLDSALEKFKKYLFELAGNETEEKILNRFKQTFDNFNERLDSIREGIHSISRVVQSLRTFYRKDNKVSHNVDILEGLKTTLSLVKTKYKDKIDFNLNTSTLPRITANPSELNQVFMNLLINACHAIETKQRDDQAFKGIITISAHPEDSGILIQFEDNGTGIKDDIQEQIFDPFFTTKPTGEGTGLGLSICYNIITEHEGMILLDSTVGKGSTFSIFIPTIAKTNTSK